MGRFSSDRTIGDYAAEIWGVRPVPVELGVAAGGRRAGRRTTASRKATARAAGGGGVPAARPRAAGDGAGARRPRRRIPSKYNQRTNIQWIPRRFGLYSSRTTTMNTEELLRDKAVMRLFPKVELHRHLEGTFPVEKLFELSLKNGLDMPRDFEAFKREVQFPKDAQPDFLLFLTKFRNHWYRSLYDVYFITYHSVRAFRDDGLYYIELRFSPEHFALENGFDRREITQLVVDAGDQAARETGLQLRYLLTFNRGKQDENEMLKLYGRLKGLPSDRIVGVDLAGDERSFPPERFRNFFAAVRADGRFRSTVHAGEVTGPGQIWTAVRELHADRIGHGTSAIEDPALQEHLRERGIALEQCITSNYQTGAWADERNHPIAALFRRGVPVTMNSDDPFIQNTDLTDDYLKAVEYFGFTLEDLVQLNLNALKAAFVSEEERRLLTLGYLSRVEEFKARFFPPAGR